MPTSGPSRRLATGNDRHTCITAVGLLSLAHERGCEAELAQALDADLQAGRLPNLPALRDRFQGRETALSDVVVDRVPLSVYDELVQSGAAA